jgi:hypothetical protein
MSAYSAYDLLSFVIPGGLIVAVGYLVAYGVPATEPGATYLVIFLAAAFLAGHVNVALASWAEPVLWGRRPGGRVGSLWGLTGPGGTLAESWGDLRSRLAERYGSDLSDQELFDRAYVELQQTKRDDFLKILDSQVGFYRNATVACFLSTFVLAAGGLMGLAQHLPWIVGAGILLLGAVACQYRYRRFRRHFGAHVVRSSALLQNADPVTRTPSPAHSP